MCCCPGDDVDRQEQGPRPGTERRNAEGSIKGSGLLMESMSNQCPRADDSRSRHEAAYRMLEEVFA
jgi:hypothetical protein